jgi:hypothetical protein
VAVSRHHELDRSLDNQLCRPPQFTARRRPSNARNPLCYNKFETTCAVCICRFGPSKPILLWLEEFLRYHRDKSGRWQHPTQLGNDAINDFLTYLAVDRKVSASTQNQALSAILFLYRKVLKLEISIDAERAKTPERLPVVLSVDEVRRVLSCSALFHIHLAALPRADDTLAAGPPRSRKSD